MIQDSIIVKNRHQRFIRTVCESECVIGLESEDGFATSSSNEFEDDDENPMGIICFWSEKALAKACVKEGWKDYQPTEMKLSDFMENWCIGMYNDGLLVGTNFDQNMFGYEIEPLELLLELIDELKRTGKYLVFNKFEGIADLENQVKDILS